MAVNCEQGINLQTLHNKFKEREEEKFFSKKWAREEHTPRAKSGKDYSHIFMKNKM